MAKLMKTLNGYTIHDEDAHTSIGDLSALTTQDKSSLVAAINEAAASGGGDEKKSSITLYNASDDTITSAISIGTKSGSVQTGSGTTANGPAAHAEGSNTTADGAHSHAEGGGSRAVGAQSHAEGASTTASGAQSHAEGAGTTASGIQSHAEGTATTASGLMSHAEGHGTIANHESQHVFGAYNIEDPSTEDAMSRGKYIEIVGNGGSASKSNARTLDWGGNERLAGNLYVNTSNDGTGGKEVATKEYVDAAVSGGGGSDEKKSSITLYDANDDTITSVISIGTQIGSVQIGIGTTASGVMSHAEGNSTTASGNNAHAEGSGTKAIGSFSHAEGGGTTASGAQSHAEGVDTTASGDRSHAEGQGGTYEVKQGTTTQTITSGAFYTADHSEGYQTVAGRPLESGETRSILGAHAEGFHTQATGDASHSEGQDTKATGATSHAEGGYTTASGKTSHAEGGGTQAIGNQSHAEGAGTKASGDSSHAEGGGTTASGTWAHAEGGGTTASGDNSHAEGSGTTASGDHSHAEGMGGIYEKTESDGTKTTVTSGAIYTADHAEGYQTVAGRPLASGETRSTFGAHAEGHRTQATGDAAHAEGANTTASGYVSHAEGMFTTASGETSHAEGNTTIANHASQHVFGEYNIEDPSTASAGTRGTYVEIVGNGTDATKSNARTLDWNGNERLAGNLYVNANSNGTGGKEVAPKEYVDTAISNLDIPTSSDIQTAVDTAITQGDYATKTDVQDAIDEAMSGGGGDEKVSSITLYGKDSEQQEITSTISIGSKSDSIRQGYNTQANGDYSHAEGFGAKANGDNSHAEGDRTTASGHSSHAEGGVTTASGFESHAEGEGTTASGRASHTEGEGTIANHKAQHVIGEYNVADTSDAESTANGTFVEIVGNGTANNKRANARTLDWQGNERLAGTLYVNANKDGTGGTAVATTATVFDKILLKGADNKTYELTIDASGAIKVQQAT